MCVPPGIKLLPPCPGPTEEELYYKEEKQMNFSKEEEKSFENN